MAPAGFLATKDHLQDWADAVVPSQEEKSYKKRVQDAVVKTLQKTNKLTVQEAVVGGSAAKGTDLTDSDRDIVLKIGELETMSDVKRQGITETNRKMEDLFQQRHFDTPLDEFNVDILRTTDHAVTISVRAKTGDIKNAVELDLLPTIDLKAKEHPKKVVHKLEALSPKLRDDVSAAVTENQRDFVKGLDGRVKTVIRLIKDWNKKTKPRDAKNYINSCALELIVEDAWEKAGKPASFDLEAALASVFWRLAHKEEIKFVNYKNYNKDQVSTPREGPYVFDPANPKNNIVGDVTDINWERIRIEAEKALQSPRLSRINPLQVLRAWPQDERDFCRVKITDFMNNGGDALELRMPMDSEFKDLKECVRVRRGHQAERVRLTFEAKTHADGTSLKVCGFKKTGVNQVHMVGQTVGG